MLKEKNEVLDKKEKRKFILLLILFCSVLIVNEAVAQNIPITELTKNKYALQNLKLALSSDNCGVKRSAIYMIGRYKIAEGEIILENMLHTEKDPCTKVFIMLVLLELNEQKGLGALKDLAKNELNEDIIKTATHIFYEHLLNDFEFTDEKR